MIAWPKIKKSLFSPGATIGLESLENIKQFKDNNLTSLQWLCSVPTITKQWGLFNSDHIVHPKHLKKCIFKASPVTLILVLTIVAEHFILRSAAVANLNTQPYAYHFIIITFFKINVPVIDRNCVTEKKLFDWLF